AMVIRPAKVLELGVDRFVSHAPAGLLVVDEVPEQSPAHQVLMACRGALPTVVHAGVPDLQTYDRVVSDHYTGAKALTQWLLARGRRRILRVWLSEHERHWLSRRSRGYCDAVQEAGVEALPELRIPGADRLGASM